MLAESPPADNHEPTIGAPPVRHPNSPINRLDTWLKRGADEIFTVTATVTPELAQRLLDRNPGNRPLRWKGDSRSVEAYARAMLRGEWLLNGEAIIISSDGQLNDGQHRLNGVIESGMAIPMHLTFGVERDSRHTVDQGAARTPGQVLAMMGEKTYNTLAHALQFVWAYDGDRHFQNRPTMEQLLKTLEQHPNIRDTLHQASLLSSDFRASIGYMGGSHYVCRRINEQVADDFLAAVKTGLNISDPKSAVFRLRKRLIDHTAKRENIPAVEQAALYIKAFNAVLQNRSVGQLVWRRYGPAAEDFPVAGA